MSCVCVSCADCYLVLYTFYNPNDNMKQAYLCYFWEGRSSSNRWYTSGLCRGL